MKKTLIFNGSPRVKGDTVSLIDIVLKDLEGEFKIVNAYRSSIAPCIDCRYCYEKDGCAINDGMQEIYNYIQECDNIIIASPIYFSQPTGKLLDVASRLQTYFCARHFRNEEPVQKPKKGGVVLVGGGDGDVVSAYETSRILLNHMNCHNVYEAVYSHNTNARPAVDDADVIDKIKDLVAFLNND